MAAVAFDEIDASANSGRCDQGRACPCLDVAGRKVRGRAREAMGIPSRMPGGANAQARHLRCFLGALGWRLLIPCGLERRCFWLIN